MNSIKPILTAFIVFLLLFGCIGTQPSLSKEGDWGAKPGNITQPEPFKPTSQSQNQPPQNPQQNYSAPPSKEEFYFPQLDMSAPQSPPVSGENKTIKLNNLEITYYSTAASYDRFSMGADLLIHVKNTGDKTETIYSTPIKELDETYVPNWCMHFFTFQDETITLKPGEEKTLHYFASNDGDGEYTVDFGFWQKSDKSDKVTASVKFYSSRDGGKLSNGALVYGYVRDAETNKTLDNVEVQITAFSGREGYRGQSDNNGVYYLSLPSMDDIQAFFGDQEFAYSSIAYSAEVENEGYAYYYADGIEPKRGEQLRLDIYLKPKTDKNYSMKWENKVSEPYGFFWVLADSNMKFLVASQAKHTPELNKPTHFYLFNFETGQKIWSYPTDNECWGIDISEDGKTVAAGCHDSKTYIINTEDGSLRWKYDNPSMNREVAISHNGKYVLTGPAGNGNEKYDFALFDANNGNMINGAGGYDLWLRNSKFTSDDSEYVVGLSEGVVAMYDTQTAGKRWINYIGEFPLFLAIDIQDNTYAAGKGRTLFSYDKNGNVRWSYRVPDHTVTAGAITPDGSYVVVGTVGGWVHYLDGKTGKVLWRAKIKGENVAHNAVSISDDGKTVAIGSGPENHLTIFNEHGTKIFEDEAELNPDLILNDKWATIGPTSSAGSQKGIMSTYTSADGSIVVAGYGDDYIREFVR